MKSRLFVITLALFAIIIVFNAGYVLGQSPIAPYRVFPSYPSGETADAFAPFWEAVDMVETRYYRQPIDQDALVEGAINGMLETLDDPYSFYLSPTDEEAERAGFDGEIQGIGVEVSEDEGNIVVIAPIDGSPASEAGLLPGDILRQANGTDLTGLTVMEAAQIVRGPQGTDVTLLVERNGETFEVVVTRDVVKIDSVYGEMLDDNIAYVRLSQFGLQSAQEMADSLEELMAQEPIGLILDLRRNPGGSLDTVVDIADEFLPDGLVLIQEFSGESQIKYDTKDGGLAEEIPMVVLVDEGSASAAEVLAGAIQDRDRGVLIGQTSFGKGTIQNWQQLSNGGGLRLTIARWLTPDGNWVNHEGLTPDYRVDLPVFAPGQESGDMQLNAAVKYLLGEPVLESPPAAEES